MKIVISIFLVSYLGGFELAKAQTEYVTDGVPTAAEEEIRWLLNRGRFDSVAENMLRGTAYTDIPATSGPLATHASLLLSTRHHSEDMARRNVFQHATVTGSFYYNPVTQPNPWDRMLAEGYAWSGAGENIAAGYPTASAAYVGWWNSTGHRTNMFGAGNREVGSSFFYDASSTYRRYDTMNLGSRGNAHFFTDTIFHDANANGAYNQGEGVTDVRVDIRAGGANLGPYDRSESAGNFAIPLQAISSGTVAYVTLSNIGTSMKVMTIPTSYAASITLQLAPGAKRLWGHFTKASGENVGFRNLSPAPVPSLQLTVSGNDAQVSWASHASYRYQLFSSIDLIVWSPMTTSPVMGTGAAMSVTDAGVVPGRKFYRLELSTP